MSQMPSIHRCARPRGRALRRNLALLAPFCAAALTGCVDAAVTPHVPAPPQDATPLFWELRNNHRAVTLSTVAPYDTLRIVPVPRDAAGRPLSLEGSVSFRSSAPGRVEVTADGLIRAVGVGVNTYIIATFVAEGNLRHVDTTVVNVTAIASPPAVARFSVQPVAPDSSHWVMHTDVMGLHPAYIKRPPLRIEDAAGKPITGAAVRYTSSDPLLAPIHSFNGEIKSKRLGRATFTAEATIYGTTWRDSLEYEFDWPAMGWVTVVSFTPAGGAPQLLISPRVVRIGKGGTVVFTINSVKDSLEVVFDDPTHVAERTTLGCPQATDRGGSGNIPPWNDAPAGGFQNCRSRRFPVPGRYPFRILPSGTTGTIIVEESAL